MNYLNISKSMFRHYRQVFWPHIDFVVFLFLLIFRHFRGRNFGRSSVFLAVNFILPNASPLLFCRKTQCFQVYILAPGKAVYWTQILEHALPVSGLVTTCPVREFDLQFLDTLESLCFLFLFFLQYFFFLANLSDILVV